MIRGQVCLESRSSFLPGTSRRHCSARESGSCDRKTDHILEFRNSSIAVPLTGAWIIGVGPLHRARFPFSLCAQRESFHPLYNATRTKATLLPSRHGIPGRALGHVVLSLLPIKELLRTAKCIGLTKAASAGYACIPKSRLRLGTSTATPRGSFPGNSWRSGERSRVLTPFREGRSRDFCCVPCGRFTDHRRTFVVSRKAKKRSVQNGVPHPWPSWALEYAPPNSEPRVPRSLRHSFLFGVTFSRIHCSEPHSAAATLGFVRVRCPGIISADAREREAA